MTIRVAVLSKVLGKVITEKVPLEQRSEEVREQARHYMEEYCFRMRREPAHCEAAVYLAFWRSNEVAIVSGLCEESSRREARQLLGTCDIITSVHFFKINNYPLLFDCHSSFLSSSYV